MHMTQQSFQEAGWLYFPIEPLETWSVRQWFVDHVGPAENDFSAQGVGWAVRCQKTQTELVAGVHVDPKYLGPNNLMLFQLVWA
jgi:hypothetical protein